MAKPSITIINNTDTFQNWINKTNEMVNIFKDEALTASGGVGDTTTGNATLIGDFTVNNLTAVEVVNANTLSSAGNAQISVDTPLLIETSGQVGAIFNNAAGGRNQFVSNTLTWDVGIHNDTNNNFVLNTGSGDFKFILSPSGELTIPSLVVSGSVTADLGLTTADVEEDAAALYFTDALAQDAFIAGDDVTFSAPDANGKRTISASSSDADTVGGISPDSFLRSDQSDTMTGNLTVTGDITSNGSASDISLKENIQVIEDAGYKVSQLNGYTFNYKDSPDEAMTGVLAHELEAVLPEAVYVYDVDYYGREIKAVRYGNVVGLLIEAIKDLQERLDELEKS